MHRPLLVVLGAAVAVAGVVVHRQLVLVDEVTVPWGLAAVIVVSAVVAFVAAGVGPIGGAWFGLGWSAVLLAENVAPTSSVLVATDWLGWSFVLGTLTAITLAVIAGGDRGH